MGWLDEHRKVYRFNGTLFTGIVVVLAFLLVTIMSGACRGESEEEPQILLADNAVEIPATVIEW